MREGRWGKRPGLLEKVVLADLKKKKIPFGETVPFPPVCLDQDSRRAAVRVGVRGCAGDGEGPCWVLDDDAESPN